MAAKSWLKVMVETDPVLVDAVGDFFAGFYGAAVENGAPGEAGERTVTAWFEEADSQESARKEILGALDACLAELEAAVGCPGSSTVHWEMIQEQDWLAGWKEHFTPFAIVDGLVITPGWEEYRPDPGEKVLTIDPGMAFGTGHHDTTAFTIELIREAVAEGGRTLLDVGTGTGIVAMAGLLFGADSAVGIDNDPEAVRVAKENAARNGLTEQLEITDTPVAGLEGEFDIVAANIIHDVLVAIAADLVKRVAPGGSLILSGILVGEQTAAVLGLFSALGLRPVGEYRGSEWAALRFINDDGR